MKMKLLSLAVLFLFVSALMGCGEKKEAKTEEGKATAKVEKAEDPTAAAPEQKPPEQQPAAVAEQKAPEPAAGEVTIVGSVDTAGKVIAEDGQAYVIVDNDAGKELIKMVAKKVEVKGAVSEKEGAKTITVTAYQEAK
ncbi:MAG: hypothetical protein MUO52_05525 [Desulfobacterales bacterium]|nr:hypothetical protein [Desulfobacterales bacterium]